MGRRCQLWIGDTEEFGHLVVEEALAGLVGLDPFAVDDELGMARLPVLAMTSSAAPGVCSMSISLKGM